MYFTAPNLVTLAVVPAEPWTFAPTEKITPQIRDDKTTRQNWYRNLETRHCFYTMLEGVNSNQRISKENPPHAIHGFVADYDIRLPAERVQEAIREMEVKPTRIETSLGGNFRLVWELESPLLVDGRDFCIAIMQAAHKWLRLGLLPELDRKAFEETTRLYCNGCQWQETGHGRIPVSKSQAFFVECGRKFQFPETEEGEIPLDVVEKGLKEKYPTFDWPAEFAVESPGPTFWIADSVSPLSAIVKPGGMFTFAAHAAKPFYSWGDLLGKEFIQNFQETAIAQATHEIWWDSKRFWLRKNGIYVSLDRTELLSYLKVTCRLSDRKVRGGVSPMDSAVEHIYRHQSVNGAAPFVFVRSGLYYHDGLRKLNTWTGKPMEPASGSQQWGAQGNFPALSSWLDQLLSTPEQLAHLLAWAKYFFTAAINYEPLPGPNVVMMGVAGIGKTFCFRNVIGPVVGGFVDASNYLVEGNSFNSELFHCALWCLDDDAPSTSPSAQARLAAMLKKSAANQQHLCNAKFERATMVGWAGRIACTTNLDFVSMKIIGPLDDTSLDKTSLYRCNPTPTFQFPSRRDWASTVTGELPFFMRYAVDHTPPDFVRVDRRWGYSSYHEPTLLERTSQSSPSSSFREVVIEFFVQWFQDNAEIPFWEGPTSSLLRMLMATQCNDTILKHLKLEQIGRYMEQLQREGVYRIESRTGAHGIRLWRFHRHDFAG